MSGFAANISATARNEKLMRLGKLVLVLLVAIAAVGGASYLAVSGAVIHSKSELALGLFIVAMPLLVYFALQQPFIFPFGVYVLLVPIDPLLQLNPRVGTLTKLIALGAGLALVFWLIRHKTYVKPDKAMLWWIVLLCWMALSVFWAMDTKVAVTRVTTYAELIALYMAVALMPINRIQYKAFTAAIVLSGLLGAAGSVYLYRTGLFVLHQLSRGVNTSRLQVKIADSALNPDGFSVALLLPTAIVLMWALSRRWSLAKLAYIGLFFVMLGGIYVNGARAALVALSVLIAYLFVRSRYKGQLLVLALLAAGFTLVSPTNPWARFMTAIDSGGSGRLSIWKVGLEAFKRHWLMGAGSGNFPQAYSQSFLEVYQRIYASWFRAPHNIIVEVCVELGVIGLVIFLAAWYTQWRSLSVIPRWSRLYDARLALEGTIVALFVQGLFANLMIGKASWLVFIAIMATRSLYLSEPEPQPIQLLPLYPRIERQLPAPVVAREPINA